MTPEQVALRDAFLAEMWKPCPEWRQTKDERREAAERNATLASASTVDPQDSAQPSTGCSEISVTECSQGHTECA